MSLSLAVSFLALTKKWAPPPQARCAVLASCACARLQPSSPGLFHFSLWSTLDFPTPPLFRENTCILCMFFWSDSYSALSFVFCPFSFVSFLADLCSLKVQNALCIPRPQLTWMWSWHRKEKNCLLLPSPAVLLCPLLSPSSTLFTFSLFLYPRMLLKGWSLWRQDYPQGKDSRVNI